MAKSNENNSNQQSNNTDNISADSTVVMLYSFTQQGKGKWRIQNDVVMGGRSKSQLQMTEDNNAHFSGRVSLENNGGFCSIHHTVENDPYNLTDEMSAFVLRLNGDGKDYSFRVRTPNGRHLYGYTFSTKADGQWETVSIPFNKMKAKYHGEPVNVPNYAGENVIEMQLLIGNKKEETFEIVIESIGVH